MHAACRQLTTRIIIGGKTREWCRTALWRSGPSACLLCYQSCQPPPGTVPGQRSSRSCVPAGEVLLGTARHPPPFLIAATKVPCATICQCWLAAPAAQVKSSIFAPIRPAPPATVMHLLPKIRRVPSVRTCQLCAALPLQAKTSITLPLAPELKWSSAHEPIIPANSGPPGAAHSSPRLAVQGAVSYTHLRAHETRHD